MKEMEMYQRRKWRKSYVSKVSHHYISRAFPIHFNEEQRENLISCNLIPLYFCVFFCDVNCPLL